MLFGLSAGAQFRRRQPRAPRAAAECAADAAGSGRGSSPGEVCTLGGLSEADSLAAQHGEGHGRRQWRSRRHSAQLASLVRGARESVMGPQRRPAAAEGAAAAAEGACCERPAPRQSRAGRRRMEREIRRRFGEIDTDRDGFVTESDLMRYACSRRLPKSYVRCFINHAKRGAGRPARAAGLRAALASLLGVAPAAAADTADAAGPALGLSWEDFRDFSLSRDEALSGHFMCLDGDGKQAKQK